jgi:anti-sigma factor RsiW
MNADFPIREEDLHAYLDGELPPKRAAAVEAYLREHPADARRLAAYRADGEALARLFASPASPPRPVREATPAPRPQARWRAGMALAASLLIGMLGLAAAVLTGGDAQSEHAALLEEIAGYHRIYARETKHLVEVGADRRDEIVAWLGSRLGRRLAIPDLGPRGFTFAGARLLVVNRQPVAQLLYTRPGSLPVGICLTRGGEPRPRSVVERDGLRLASWSADGYTYVVVGDMSDRTARALADSVEASFRG